MNEETDLIVELAGCSLERVPGHQNWLDAPGMELPDYICRIARALHREGRSISTSIAMAVASVKRWASGAGNVNADTRAKAAKAVAEWEALKAKAAARRGAREGADAALSDTLSLAESRPYGDVVYADPGWREDKIKRYPLDTESRVRAAWSYINMDRNRKFYDADQLARIERAIREAGDKFGIRFVSEKLSLTAVELDTLYRETARKLGELNPTNRYEPELWTDAVVFRDEENIWYRMAWEATDDGIVFGEPEPVRKVWEPLELDRLEPVGDEPEVE